MRGFALWALMCAMTGTLGWNAAAVEPITESEVVRVIPVLRAWGPLVGAMKSRADSSTERSKEAVAERMQLLEQIKSGAVDPLEWMKKNAPSLRIPPLITYSPECSKLASGLLMGPAAVFGFGIEASEYGLALISGEKNIQPGADTSALADTDAQKKVEAVVNAMRIFYSEEKYPGFRNDAPLYWSTVSPDSSLRISVIEANVYRAWGCDTLPTGPLLEVAWNETPENLAWSGNSSAIADLKTILGNAGMSEGGFLSLVTALAVARKDHRNPDALKIDESSPPQSDEEEKLLAEVKKMTDVRIRNMRIYERYADTLDPLLDLFEGGVK
jgi:hypothetical protein